MSNVPRFDPSRTIEVSRLVDAPRDLVFNVLSQAKHIDALIAALDDIFARGIADSTVRFVAKNIKRVFLHA